MASAVRNCVHQLALLERRHLFLIFFRGSRYEPSYIANTKSLEELKKPLAADDQRNFSPIKAALTDDSTFTDYDPVLQKFTNMVMRQGNKCLSRELLNKTFENIKRIQLEKYHKAEEEAKHSIELDPLTIFRSAIDNGKPLLHLVKVVKGGTKYQVPVICNANRQQFLSMKWLIEAGKEKERSERFFDKLAKEIVAAHENKGGLIKRKQELHKQCEANKAFAHYRW